MTAQDILALPNAYRLTVDDFLLLDQAGALQRFAKTELIEGVLVTVNAQYVAHARAQRAMFRALDDACRRIGGGLEVLFETSLDFDAETRPQPDVVVARSLPGDGPLPSAAVVLVVEVADTSLAFDLGAKARIYAGAGVPEYWVMDIAARVIHQLCAPEGERYAEQSKAPFGSQLNSVTVPALAVDTASF